MDEKEDRWDKALKIKTTGYLHRLIRRLRQMCIRDR